jgi:nitrous oxide reductase accessory protein NosL
MRPRRALRRRSRWAALAAALALAGCPPPATGPVRIAWGRDACQHCGMAIGDERFAAQVRRGPRDAARFDDFGCAVAWLEEHGGPDTAAEIWVMDEDRREWIDARRASYRSGRATPMGYGFGAASAAAPGDLDFAAARARVLEREGERASRRPR